ncbi:hypothetical protein PN488_13345 [Nodularia spumigena CS-591/12]|uniref:hypothetical protein n=1 Tax=Nodularia spumigena TaxID=70799 RepID=UPI00232EAB7C|nr:hypothetical protein [Nodularia spumigena]MDB9305351.1 hypothetical protein [Nodularia spumigena CS-591/12]MDB9346754.1 hypothetical protein [Nodularia spumigena CS-588/01]MDB9352654.1 hypothetical protein [Nodularia spumigena CS-588/05]
MSSPRTKIALKVFLDSLPSNYPKHPLFLIIYAFLVFIVLWIMITLIIGFIGYIFIMPLGFMGIRDLMYECNRLENFNQISTTCTTRDWVGFFTFLLTVLMFFTPIRPENW